MKVFAHRGASGHYPENTLLAIKKALQADINGIEVDVYQIENKLIIIHDRWLHRTTNGKGKIFDYSFNELRCLDAGQGEKIPTLDEVLMLVAGKCVINIEIKGVRDLALLYQSLNQAQLKYGFEAKQLLISSFNHQQLKQINAQHSQYPIGALTACLPLDYALFAKQLNAFSVHICIDFIDQNFVENAHSYGLKVFVYTVDDAKDIDAMKALGVDGIFSNYPMESKKHITLN